MPFEPNPEGSGEVFQADFLIAIRALVNVHHSIYRKLPPQGIYFESLVQEAFRWIKQPFTPIKGGKPNAAGHDLLVESKRLSLKTETGHGTQRDCINITKLCTTEREPWSAEALIDRVLQHLNRYDIILMLRAVWKLPIITYQLLEIPIDDLKLIAECHPEPIGKRPSRQSLGADVYRGQDKLFYVYFDGADGKCTVRALPVQNCKKLLVWDVLIN